MDSYTIGTCEEMCPRNELIRREKNGSLHIFEVKQGSKTKYPKADPSKIVKEFRRSAAGFGLKANEIRPTHILKKTIIYLIKNLIPRTDVSWNVVYDFVFDRIRAIRQDLVIQNSIGADCQFILKTAVKFYVYSAYRLCEQPILVFDPHINGTHLQECLKQLMRLYENDNSCLDPEVVSVYLLYNLESDETLYFVLSLPSSIRYLPDIKNAIQLVLSWRQRNYARVFRMINNLTFFQLCAIHVQLQHIRREILNIMSAAYNRTSLPLTFLEKVLNAKSEDVESLCSFYGIELKEGTALLCKINFNKDRKMFPSFKCHFVENQLEGYQVERLIIGINS